jgi:hypothetical protein
LLSVIQQKKLIQSKNVFELPLKWKNRSTDVTHPFNVYALPSTHPQSFNNTPSMAWTHFLQQTTSLIPRGVLPPPPHITIKFFQFFPFLGSFLSCMMMLAKQSKTAKKYPSKMIFYSIHLRFSSLFQLLVFIGLNHN